MAGEISEGEQRFSDEQMLAEFEKLQGHGAIEYVIPTEPIGEGWVLGIDGQVANLSPDGAFGFLMGATAVARVFAQRAGVEL